MSQELLESLMQISIEPDLLPDTNVIYDNIGKSATELSKLLIF